MGRLLERYQNAIECQDQIRPLHQRLGAFLPEIRRMESLGVNPNSIQVKR